MTRMFIATKTVTLAMRCRDILKVHGFSATVEKRTAVTGGCSYGVVVTADKQELLRVLKEKNVYVMKIYEI